MLCLRQVISTVIFITSFQQVYVTVAVYLCLVFQKLPFRFLNQSITVISSCFLSCYMSHQSNPSLLNHPSNIKWLTFLSFSICNFLHTNIILFFSQILFSVFVLNDIPHYSGFQSFTPMQDNGQNCYTFWISNLPIGDRKVKDSYLNISNYFISHSTTNFITNISVC
jgi:hypothetical protein